MKKKYLISRRYEDVGSYLREARLRQDITQKQVADLLGYSSLQFISNFERGISLPPTSKLKILIKLFKLNAAEVVEIVQASEKRLLESKLGIKLSKADKMKVG
ncbi:MAG: XRE family transcriptional regulator [Proteobacteria bacterium]|nr:MAG: XRE family transcriptional regulator [Pseudomonadota bacterium]